MADSQARVKAVVFDFGGVMTTTTMPERVKPIVDGLGLPWSAIEAGYGRYRRLMDASLISMAAMYDLIFADAAIAVDPAALAKIVEEDVASFLYRNERTLAWMRALKAEGYKIGILTNMSADFAVRFREAFPDFIAEADAVVISGEEHMFKPQRRIYDLVSQRLGLPPESLVFIDDAEANCAGARAAGWQAIRFVSNDQVERDLPFSTRGVGILV